MEQVKLDFSKLLGTPENKAVESKISPENEIDVKRYLEKPKPFKDGPITLNYKEDTKRDYKDLNHEKKAIQNKKDRIERIEKGTARARRDIPDLLNGLHEGQPAEVLLLRAVKALSLAIDDPGLYRQVHDSMIKVHGEILGNQQYKQIELEDVLGDIVKLQEAIQAEHDIKEKHRISLALRAHERRFEELQKQLEQ